MIPSLFLKKMLFGGVFRLHSGEFTLFLRIVSLIASLAWRRGATKRRADGIIGLYPNGPEAGSIPSGGKATQVPVLLFFGG